MPDQYTEVTRKGWGTRMLESIKSIVVGFLLFIISFGVLYFNEGRINLSNVAKKSIEVQSTALASTDLGKQLVSATGLFKSEEKLGDTYFKTDDYIAIQRDVEMYAWQEDEKSENKTEMGGSEITETTYTYTTEWTSKPEESKGFKKPGGHYNPPMAINNISKRVDAAKLGVYDVVMNTINLPSYKKVKLSKDNVVLSNDLKLSSEDYLFKGKGVLFSPQVGDVRVSYSVVYNPVEKATIFGAIDLQDKSIVPYYVKKNTVLYRIFGSDRDTAISTMATEHSVMTWMLRLFGFLMMWFGLIALFGPISVILDIVPVLGSFGRVGVGLITFIVSLVLSIVTIIASMIIHNIIALIVIILVSIVVLVIYLKNKSKKKVGVSGV